METMGIPPDTKLSSSSSSRSSSSDNFWLGYVVGSSNSSSSRSSSSSGSNNKDAGAALGAVLLVGAAVGASILAGYSTWLNFGPAPQPLPPQGEKAKILASASDVIAKARGEILKPIAI